jgi:tetratricopeptide (TPR) repeat protein
MAPSGRFSRHDNAKEITMRRLISLLCLLSIVAVLPVKPISAQEGVLDLFVTNTDEKPQAGAILSPKGRGSVSSPTDHTGRTRIKVPGAKPGKWVTLQLVRGPDGASGWYLVSPWKGRTVCPEMDNNPDNFLTVIIAKNRDRKVLTNKAAMRSVGIGVMMAEASLSVTATATAEQRQLALASQAQVMGLEASEIDQSIRTLLGSSKDPFERGLLASYNKSFPEAIAELNKFLQESPKASVRKPSAHFFLGQAYQAVGEYSRAIDAYRLNTASDVLSLSAMGLAFKLAGDESGAESVFYTALMSDSTDAMSKVQLMTNLGKIYDQQKQADKLARFYATAESTLDREFFNLTTPAVRDKQYFAQGFNKTFQDQFVDELNAGLKRSADAGDKRGQAEYLADLGSVYFWSNDYQKALNYYQNAERVAMETNTPAHVETTLGLAMSYKSQQQYEKAVEYVLKSLPLIKDLGNPQLEIFALQHLGESYLALKKVDEAKKYFEQAVAGIQLNLGPDDPSLTDPRSGLARVYYEQGKLTEARQEVSEILAIRQKALGPNSPYVASSLTDLAELSRRQKTYDEAVKLYQQSLAILESTNKPDLRERVKYVTLRLASVYEEQNKLTEALALYDKALALQTDNRQGPERALTLARLARIHVQQQRNAEAQNLYQQAFEIIKNSDPKRTDLTDVLKDYANLLRVMQQENEAAKVDAMVRARTSSTTTTPGG